VESVEAEQWFVRHGDPPPSARSWCRTAMRVTSHGQRLAPGVGWARWALPYLGPSHGQNEPDGLLRIRRVFVILSASNAAAGFVRLIRAGPLYKGELPQ